MPRLLANEFVYSTASIDERYNEYIAPTTSPLQQYHSQHNQQQSLIGAQPGVSSQNRSSKSGSHSPPCHQMKTFSTAPVSDEGLNYSPNLQTEPHSQQQHHNVRTVSSIDDNDEVDDDEPPTVEELLTSIRSDDDEGDFEGFDDNCTPDSSGFIHQCQNQENDTELQKRCVLKRHAQEDYHEYREDSEGVVEAIEVDDDEDIEEVDGQILLRTKQETMSVKVEDPYAECNPHTPNKRKKHQIEAVCDVVSPSHLKTQHDQIVEINSDSTTISQKQKRHQINTKFQLNLNQRQNHRANNNAGANKCSTESTSEFPVSSPSNPQQPRGGGKYPPRPPLLKNTLPADSFERQLAMITACNPQMTLTEKIQSWCCEDELSDVEDVNVFDREFKRLEEQRKRDLKKHKNKRSAGIEKQYDFSVFRQMIINNMNNQLHQRFLSGAGAAGSCAAGGGLKDINSTGSDSSKSAKLNDERPSTSAVAQQQLQLRRSKLPNINMESSELKKRFNKDLPKRNQNSTTPPATSSSENDRECFQNSKISGPNKRFTHGSQQHLHINQKMICPSSSEEANSQDIPTHMLLKSNQAMLQIGGERNVRQKSPLRPPQDKSNSKNLRCLPAEEIDSVFRLHRLNREIDKPINYRTILKQPPKIEVDTSDCDFNEGQVKLAQIHLDFAEEDKKSDKIDYIQKQEIFKTPIVPPKYLATPSASADSNPLQYCSATNADNASSEQISTILTAAVESTGMINSIATESSDITITKVKLENVGTDTDFDGVYHQQHEFCNYLGLTGMSTATAMANAVAELAQCNLTRRSMRVLRLQQQERREKSAKEDRDLRSLKTKQLKEVGKRERGGYEVPVESEESLLFCEEGTNSQTSDQPTRSTPSLKGHKKKNTNVLATRKSPTKPVTIIKTEPQIKILCHIETTKQEDAEKISKECVKEFVQPIRESLMRHSKKINNLKNVNSGKIIDIKEEIVSETKTDSVHDDELKLEQILLLDSNVDGNKITLRSPRLKSMRGKLKQTKIKTDILEDMEQKLLKDQEFLSEQRVKTSRLEQVTSPLANIATVDSDFGHALIMQAQLKSSPLPNKETINKDLDMVDEIQTSGVDEHLEECDGAVTPTAAPIQEKLQAALEESRKTKPSIFIVQSFECKKEKTTKPVSILQPLQKDKVEMKPVSTTGAQTVSTSPSKVEIKKQMSNEQSDIRSEHTTAIIKNKNSKKHLKAPRKSKKHSIFSLKNGSKRKLRSHKIIFIKSGQSEENLIEEIPKEVKRLRSHNKSLSTYNLSKPSFIAEKATDNSLAPSTSQSNATTLNNTKSYRNAQTETKDLEMYNSQAKTRLMAKATALLQRSRRMSVTRGLNSSINLRSKFSAKLRRSTISLRTAATTKKQILQPKICLIRANIDEPKKEYKTSSTSPTPPPSESKVDDLKPMTSSAIKLATTTHNQQQPSRTCSLNQENENVVVSSTTNSFDERPHINPLLIPSPITLRSVHSSTPCVIASSPLEIKDSWTQIDNNVQTIQYLNSPPSATHVMRNPLKTEHGVVLYIYFEVDILIVVQERLVSFWKCSRLLSALSVISPTQQQKQFNSHLNVISSQASSSSAQIKSDIFTSDSLHTSSCIDLQIRVPALSSSSLETSHQINGEWILLGELKRLTYDLEVFAPYANRICLHNSTPIYMEMRARHLPKNHRDCNLLSIYINIYYYHDEDIIAKTNSIQLDTIQSDVKTVNYTTLIDSRYFIMTWPQENLLGKTRSGLCKYSLTPQLDTLASIREFKSMRHTIRYLECMSDDKLIGFGDSQLTIWDHRSGDVLMNFDLDIPLGRNLGSVYYSSQEIEQNNMIILFQWRDIKPNELPELLTIACTITHVQPSYRILYQLTLPPAFRKIKRAINTGEHLIIVGSESGESEEELWISCGNPALVALVPPLRQEMKRFYNRERSQLIELTENTLNLDTLANHNLKLAASLALNTE